MTDKTEAITVSLLIPLALFIAVQVTFYVGTPLREGHDEYITGEAYRMAWNMLYHFKQTHGLNVIEPIREGAIPVVYYSFPPLLNWCLAAISLISGLSVSGLRIGAVFFSATAFLGLHLFSQEVRRPRSHVACWLALGEAPVIWYGSLPEESLVCVGPAIVALALLRKEYSSRTSLIFLALTTICAVALSYHILAVILPFAGMRLFFARSMRASERHKLHFKLCIMLLSAAASFALMLAYVIAASSAIDSSLHPVGAMLEAFRYRSFSSFDVSFCALFSQLLRYLVTDYANISLVLLCLVPACAFFRRSMRARFDSPLALALAALFSLILLKNATYFHEYSYIVLGLAMAGMGNDLLGRLKAFNNFSACLFTSVLILAHLAFGARLTWHEITPRFSQQAVHAFMQSLKHDDFVVYPKSLGRGVLHARNPDNMLYYDDKYAKLSLEDVMVRQSFAGVAGRLFVVVNRTDRRNIEYLRGACIRWSGAREIIAQLPSERWSLSLCN